MFRYKSLLSLLVVYAFCSIGSLGCGDDGTGTDMEDGGTPDSAPLDSSPADAEEFPDAGEETTCVPETATFWVYDLSVMPPEYIQVDATCRGGGDHGLVFVADDIWEDPVTQDSVDAVVEAFNKSTPADPERGVFELTTTTFGEPSDVDENDRVFLLLLELPSYGGYQFDGYIRREDTLGGANSNEAELLYLEASRNEVSSEYMLGVIAHEFFHLIHINHDTTEESWLDESMAEASMILCGYLGDLDTWVADYASNPNQILVDNSPTFHYGAGFLFGGYLLERFGQDYLSALVENTGSGIISLEETWADIGENVTFNEVLGDWAAANWLDEPDVLNGFYGYTSFAVPQMSGVGPLMPGDFATVKTLKPTGTIFYEFNTADLPFDSDATITIVSSDHENMQLRVLTYPSNDRSAAQVLTLTPDAQESSFIIQGVGVSIDRVVLSVVSTAQEDMTLESVVLAVE